MNSPRFVLNIKVTTREASRDRRPGKKRNVTGVRPVNPGKKRNVTGTFRPVIFMISQRSQSLRVLFDIKQASTSTIKSRTTTASISTKKITPWHASNMLHNKHQPGAPLYHRSVCILSTALHESTFVNICKRASSATMKTRMANPRLPWTSKPPAHPSQRRHRAHGGLCADSSRCERAQQTRQSAA